MKNNYFLCQEKYFLCNVYRGLSMQTSKTFMISGQIFWSKTFSP